MIRRHKLLRMAILISASFAAFLIILSIVADIITGINGRHTDDITERDYSLYDIKSPPIKEMLLTENVNSRPGIALGSVNGIVIHYTANPGTDAEANRNYFENRKDEPDTNANKVSSHYIIGLDGTIIQCIPLNEIAYASNYRNSDTISIECCHPGKKGKFTENTYNSLIHLVAWLCSKYGLNKDAVIRHYDITGKVCPRYYVKNTRAWDKLKDDIWNYVLSHTNTDGED